jgi:hypothetical protein
MAEFNEQTADEIIHDKYSEEELNALKEKIQKYYDDNETKGCKITALIMKNAFKHNSKYLEGYLKRPLFLFYTSKDGNSIRRVIGMAQRENGEIVAEAVSAMMVMNNQIVGGIELDELIPIKKWSKNHLDKLSFGVNGADAFREPFGFVAFLS